MFFQNMKKKFLMLMFIFSTLLFLQILDVSNVFAAKEIHQYVSNVENAQVGMSLWQIIRSGGVVMLVLGLMSVGAGALIIFCFINFKVEKLVPRALTEKLIEDLEIGQEDAVKNTCKGQESIIGNVILSGLTKKKKGPVAARESMETCARKEIGFLWQTISYLADIASIAPLVGLLGTVIGMIQAFNVIAFQSGVVKPMLLAGGVSKAMVTTAGGLVVAIPVMLFYSYFRGRLQEITNHIEVYSTDAIKIIEESCDVKI
ncbi:hypothetical protein MNBD_BACTEROID05-973 [hydrothermal vent metagenome]|uniref:MotA/TolQ/ExbB proton channel domain-containing protein n=1 Tax=hydrothermal vent metagenome TaxID=652676 RepID=A0A3B0TDB3_9ZZZZ